jgi:arabinofuranan 3-O-arabinosyltransferase
LIHRRVEGPALEDFIIGARSSLIDPSEKGAGSVRATRAVDIFTGWWLGSFGVALALLYLFYFGLLYRAGSWILDSAGTPIYTDFGCGWAAGIEALRSGAAALSDPAAFAAGQAALFPAAHAFYPNWPYPPTFLLLMAPLALLPYCGAFVAWDALTLLACVAVVYLIVQRRTAIAVALAAPFTAWNFLAAQNGFLTGALVGGALLCLERRPVVAGILVGCLSYKPQFAILFPLALLAGGKWRSIAAAAAMVLGLAALSAVLFGVAAWSALPHELAAQTRLNLLSGRDSQWGYLQTVYGLARLLHADAFWAWLLQAATMAGLALAVWRVWRSAIAYRLQAAALSAAALLATPYAFAYDMAALLIPAAFLAADQLERGLLPGDKAVWIGLFGVPLALLVTLGDSARGPTFGGVPIGLGAALLLTAAVLRRAFDARGPVAAPSLVAAVSIPAPRLEGPS